jgi:hypothetical protein
MKKLIVDQLEKYLSGELSGDALKQFEAELERESGGREQVGAFQTQGDLLRTLRPDEQMDPAPGFYARVMDRIESQTAGSFWAIFFEPWFAKKLAYASLALLVALSSAAINSAANPGMHEAVPYEFVADTILPPAPGEDREYDRSVVFANLSAFTGGEPASLTLTSFE